MAPTFIKICGITNLEDALLAVRLGAFAVGLNLYAGSKRCITPERARAIVQALPKEVEPFVLFVNEPLEIALPIAESISHIVQWHGDDPPLPPPAPWWFVPAFNIVDKASLENVTAYLARCSTAGRLPSAVLLDGHAPGRYGGTGQTAPWQLIATFRPRVPVILAGGLTPENVAEAIRTVRPYAVDVSGGVESSPGKKDPAKLTQFFQAALAAVPKS